MMLISLKFLVSEMSNPFYLIYAYVYDVYIYISHVYMNKYSTHMNKISEE